MGGGGVPGDNHGHRMQLRHGMLQRAASEKGKYGKRRGHRPQVKIHRKLAGGAQLWPTGARSGGHHVAAAA